MNFIITSLALLIVVAAAAFATRVHRKRELAMLSKLSPDEVRDYLDDLQVRQKKFRRTFIIITLLVIIPVIYYFKMIYISMQEKAKSVVCASNIRQIMVGLMAYANEDKGKLPKDAEILTGFLKHHCPYHPQDDYIITFPPKSALMSARGNQIMISDRYPHPDGTMNVGYVDGHIETVSETVLMKQLKEQQEKARETASKKPKVQ